MGRKKSHGLGGVRQHAQQLEHDTEIEKKRPVSASPTIDLPEEPRKKKKRASSSNNLPDLEGSEDEEPIESNIADYQAHLKQLFVMNKLSSKDLRETGSLSSKAGSKGVKDVAKVGAKGFQPGNCHRDLKKLFRKDSSAPKPYYAQIPTHCPDSGKNGVLVWIPFLLLHEMILWLLSKKTIVVKEVSTFPKGSGQETDHHAFCKNTKIPPEKNMAIGQHMDGVPHQKRQSLECMSWNFPAIPWMERILFSCIEKAFLCRCGCAGRCTINAMLAVFIWSLNLFMYWEKCIDAS